MFTVGEEYRRPELLAFVGSKQTQAGILWGPQEQGCIMVTSGGRHSKKAGYEDRLNSDGTWTYYGQGEKGNQNPISPGNKFLIEAQRSVLLFSTREPTAAEARASGNHAKPYRFEGVFGVGGYEAHIPADGLRKGDELLRFTLVPCSGLGGPEADPDGSGSDKDLSLDQLRRNLQSMGGQPRTGTTSPHGYKKGSVQTRRYARLRAQGICECCDAPAPFVDSHARPYLEVHHLYRLADDGPDLPKNVAAVCPNCHRRAHYSREKRSILNLLEKRVLAKESLLDGAEAASGR